MSRLLRFSLSLALMMSLLGWPKPVASIAPAAPANTFSVNSTADLVDDNLGDGTCHASTGDCTLRAAFMQANVLGGPHTIILSSATYTLTIDPVAGDTIGLNGDLDITDTVSINLLGVTNGQSIIDAGNKDRAFEVFAATLNLQDVTMRNSAAIGFASLYNHVGGTLTVDRSEVSGNTGAGILNDGGTLTVKRSLLMGNTASGIYNQNNGVVNVVNSTLSGNSGTNGGGLYNGSGSMTLNNVTVASNTALSGGGLYRQGGTLVIWNSILSGNSAGSNPDCFGTLTAVFNSLIQNTTGCTFSGSGNILGQNPQLGLLQNNGGRTRTHALLPGSPAIGVGLSCVDENSQPLTADQRGSFRPQGGACDIGAYEVPAAQFAATTYTAAENVGSALITVSLDGTTALTVSVPYTASAGSATANGDFTPVTGTLTIAPNSSSANFAVPVANDLLDEPDETVLLALGSPNGALLDSPNTATLTIQDDDLPPAVSFSVGAYEVSENKGPAAITATLSAASGFTVTVGYVSGDGTAAAGSDYTAVSNTLTFALGSTIATFPVAIINDQQNEPDETVALTLTNPSHATLGAPSVATLTIHSDDPPRLYLPLVMRDYFACYGGALEIEPNNSYTQATGPLCFGQTYSGMVNVAGDRDYYTLIWQGTGQFSLDVAPIGSSTNWQAQLYYQVIDLPHLAGYLAGSNQAFHFACPGQNGGYSCSGATGQYYLVLILPDGTGYTLSVTSP